ncbi:uncharacterized protein BKA55DRAFT_695563 [Fusarium redolens]|uniref:Uncharacterized protein n=1 Tax=Fusarium redolens TaxID=48865 RepID=A0A9P9G424_FUSRE|nr:uncharacterized protein BKA55DRAFT_695563 [Fusarium redolens]KAH7232141.1 hypothetical protein BKA55DRAFT_695563 [Fusarium redolens]
MPRYLNPQIMSSRRSTEVGLEDLNEDVTEDQAQSGAIRRRGDPIDPTFYLEGEEPTIRIIQQEGTRPQEPGQMGEVDRLFYLLIASLVMNFAMLVVFMIRSGN